MVSGPCNEMPRMAPAPAGNESATKRQRMVAENGSSHPWSVDMLETPSGRRLRNVRDWHESGVDLSCTSDQAARLIDMSAEQILGVFGDPYGKWHAIFSYHPEPCVRRKSKQNCSAKIFPFHAFVNLVKDRRAGSLRTASHVCCCRMGLVRLRGCGHEG